MRTGRGHRSSSNDCAHSNAGAGLLPRVAPRFKRCAPPMSAQPAQHQRHLASSGLGSGTQHQKQMSESSRSRNYGRLNDVIPNSLGGSRGTTSSAQKMAAPLGCAVASSATYTETFAITGHLENALGDHRRNRTRLGPSSVQPRRTCSSRHRNRASLSESHRAPLAREPSTSAQAESIQTPPSAKTP